MTYDLLSTLFQYTTQPRLNLALQMRVQALCRRPVNRDATSVSLGERELIRMAECMDVVNNRSMNKFLITHPGEYLVATVINRTSNMDVFERTDIYNVYKASTDRNTAPAG
jgi:hypothetical protein